MGLSCPPKKGALRRKNQAWQGDQDHGHCRRPWSSYRLRTESASPAELKLVAATLEDRVVAEVPERLIGDKAYNSDGLDHQLMQEFGTEMISPHRHGRKVRPKMGGHCDATRAAEK
jgi:hypothetical protein